MRFCDFCIEEAIDHPEEGVATAVVCFGEQWACGWHAVFMWDDQPGQKFVGKANAAVG